jgi:hypothetical protein
VEPCCCEYGPAGRIPAAQCGGDGTRFRLCLDGSGHGHWWRFPGTGHAGVTKHVASPTPSTERSGITMEQSGVYAVLLIVFVVFATYIGSYILFL